MYTILPRFAITIPDLVPSCTRHDNAKLVSYSILLNKSRNYQNQREYNEELRASRGTRGSEVESGVKLTPYVIPLATLNE